MYFMAVFHFHVNEHTQPTIEKSLSLFMKCLLHTATVFNKECLLHSATVFNKDMKTTGTLYEVTEIVPQSSVVTWEGIEY